MDAFVREYDAKLDSRHRITLRRVQYPFFHVREYEDGRILLEPRELVEPFRISPEALEMLDGAMEELKDGYVPQTFDLFAWNN